MASRDDEHRLGLTDVAGRAAIFPARAAARVWRDQLEAAMDEVLSAPEIARVIDRAFAGSLPDEIARSIVRHRVIERVVEELSSSGELDRLLALALSSPRTVELTDRVLASDETQLALRRVASSPEVRNALRRETASLAEEVVGGVRASARRLDGRLAWARARAETTPAYGGLATRALALAIDALLALFAYMSVVGVLALVASLVGDLGPDWLVGISLGTGWLLLVGTYFVLFWSSAGQTPGMRLFHLRVRTDTGAPGVARSIVRFVGLVLSIVPLFAGFLPVPFDKQRRGLADFLAGTVVVYDGPA